MILVIGIFFMIVSLIVQWRFRSKVKRYSQESLQIGLTGREVAERMLRDNRISDVEVICVEGQLTDHYNPKNRTVNLSPDVYHGNSVISAAVAAHECGHAVQHETQYSMLALRSAMVPIVSLSSTIMNVIVIGSIFFGAFIFKAFPMQYVLLLIIGVYSIMTAFSFITLPVEFDASNRAMLWLRTNNIIRNDEEAKAKDALNWAAMTYVVAAIASLATLLYYISLYMRRD
jgi:uncharacterized protein